MGASILVVYFLPFLAIIVWLVRAIWAPISLPRKAVREPSCEKCRYPVAGLNEMRCPECGSDLRATGIITREMEVRRRGSLTTAIIALAVLWILLYVIFGGLGAGFLYGFVTTYSGPGLQWVYVALFVGWAVLGGGAALWIVRRRRALLARHADDGSAATVAWRVRQQTLAFVQWALVWTGIGLMGVAPLCGLIIAMGRKMDDDARLWAAANGAALLWTLIGVWVGGRILARRRREARAGSPTAPATPPSAAADNPGS